MVKSKFDGPFDGNGDGNGNGNGNGHRGRNGGLSADLLRQIHAELLRREAVLTHTINVELDEMRNGAEAHHMADMDDLGGDAHDEETNYRLLEIESAELELVDWALERLDAGTYGTCEECGEPIAEERLKALIFATSCIDCKRAQERREAAEQQFGEMR